MNCCTIFWFSRRVEGSVVHEISQVIWYQFNQVASPPFSKFKIDFSPAEIGCEKIQLTKKELKCTSLPKGFSAMTAVVAWVSRSHNLPFLVTNLLSLCQTQHHGSLQANWMINSQRFYGCPRSLHKTPPWDLIWFIFNSVTKDAHSHFHISHHKVEWSCRKQPQRWLAWHLIILGIGRFYHLALL